MPYRLSSRMEHVCCLAATSDSDRRTRIVEIGCDHGYLSMEILKRNYYDYVLAMDVREGPLSRAKKNIAEEFAGKREFLTRIETRISDGLLSLEENEADAALLAGMGGNLMLRIFTDGEKQFRTLPVLILQPQSEVVGLRRFLTEHDFKIVREDMVEEDGKYYPMMKAVRCDHAEELDICAATYGPRLIEERNEVLLQFLHKKQKTDERIMKSLEKENTERSARRKEELKSELTIIQQTLKRMG